MAEALGLLNVEAFTVEAGGASGGAAVHVANRMISSKEANSVLVVGVEKMRDVDPARLVLAQSLSENAEYAQFFGVSFAGLAGLLARMYMSHYNVTREKMSAFPAIAHRNSSTAEHAQFKKKFTVEEVSRSEIVADPLRVLDCAPVGDGAAAVLLTSSDYKGAEKFPVAILASESSTNQVDFFDRANPLRFDSTCVAFDKALKKARLSPDQLNFFEIHDSYSIMAAMIMEGLGVSKSGEACDDASLGLFDLRGKFPIDTFGGMKGRGYPVGAAGVYQICEAYLQLTRGAGFNQVPNAKRGLVQSMSGIDASSFIHILENAREGGRD